MHVIAIRWNTIQPTSHPPSNCILFLFFIISNAICSVSFIAGFPHWLVRSSIKSQITSSTQLHAWDMVGTQKSLNEWMNDEWLQLSPACLGAIPPLWGDFAVIYHVFIFLFPSQRKTSFSSFPKYWRTLPICLNTKKIGSGWCGIDLLWRLLTLIRIQQT